MSGAGIPVNGAGIPVRGAVLARIPSEQYSDYRYEAIFRAYKWDPQVEDHNTVAEHVVLLDKQTAGWNIGRNSCPQRPWRWSRPWLAGPI